MKILDTLDVREGSFILPNTAPPSPVDGQVYFETANNTIYVYDEASSSWTAPGAVLSGNILISGTLNLRSASTQTEDLLNMSRDSGVELSRFDHDGALFVPNTVDIGFGSTQTNGIHNLPVPTITVNSTAGFQSEGWIEVGDQRQRIKYLNKDSTHFFNCTTAGTGTVPSGTNIIQNRGITFNKYGSNIFETSYGVLSLRSPYFQLVSDTAIYPSSPTSAGTTIALSVEGNTKITGSLSTNHINSIRFFGHSGVYGGATSGFRGTDQRLGALFGADVINSSRGGSRLSYHEPSVQEIGGWPHVYRCISPGAHEKPYISNRDVVCLWYGMNDLGSLGPGSTNLAPLLNSLEAVISRSRASAVFEENHSSVTYPTGTWTRSAPGFAGYETKGGNLLFASGGYYQSASSGSISVAVPSDFPGGTVALAFLSGAAGEGASITFTVDGNAAGSLDTRDKNACDYGTSHSTGTNRYVTAAVKRFTSLSSGAHTIVATVGAVNTACLFDAWWIEASPAPICCVIGGWNTSSARPNFEFFSLGGFPYVPDSTTLAELNTLMKAKVDSFNSTNVVFVDPDPVINRDPYNFSQDHLHLSDQGHAAVADAIAAKIQGVIRSRLDHSKGGKPGFASLGPGTTDRNLIEAQQTDAVPLTLRGKQSGEHTTELLGLDGSGASPSISMGVDLSSTSNAKIGVAQTAGNFVTDSAANDFILKAYTGSLRLTAGSTTGLLLENTGNITIPNTLKIGGTINTKIINNGINLNGTGFPLLLKANESDTQSTFALVYTGAMFWGAGGSSALDVSLSRTAANELTLGSGDFLKTDDPTSAQHVSTKNYVDTRPLGTWFGYPVASSVNFPMTAGTLYYARIFIPVTASLTGIGFVVSTTASGNVKAMLFDSSGTKLKDGTDTVLSTGFFKAPFSGGAYSAVAGTYYLALIFSAGTTPTCGTALALSGSSSSGTYASPPASITPPTTGGGFVPIMTSY